MELVLKVKRTYNQNGALALSRLLGYPAFAGVLSRAFRGFLLR